MREKPQLDVTSNLGVICLLFLTVAKIDTPLIVRFKECLEHRDRIHGVAPFYQLQHFRLVESSVLKDAWTRVIHDHLLHPPHFPSVAHVLEELNLLSSKLGQLGLATSVVNEILAWIGVRCSG